MTATEPSNGQATTADQKTLTTGQRALAAARSLEQFTPDAVKRQRAGIRAPVRVKAAAQAGALYGVSTRSVEMARAILHAPALVQAVEENKITLWKAHQLVKRSFEDQREAAKGWKEDPHFDACGHLLPDGMRPIFGNAARSQARCRIRCKELLQELEALRDRRLLDPHNFLDARDSLEKAEAILYRELPSRLCPTCYGRGQASDGSRTVTCPSCNGRGWLPPARRD
jgi:hypothetical protein